LSFALENLTAITSQQQAVITVAVTPNRWRNFGLVMAVVAVSAMAFALRGFLVHWPQAEYRQVTFPRIPQMRRDSRRDGRTIIYAAWDRPGIKLYSSRVDGTDVPTLNLPRDQPRLRWAIHIRIC
jgi:hypothetical protein